MHTSLIRLVIWWLEVPASCHTQLKQGVTEWTNDLPSNFILTSCLPYLIFTTTTYHCSFCTLILWRFMEYGSSSMKSWANHLNGSLFLICSYILLSYPLNLGVLDPLLSFKTKVTKIIYVYRWIKLASKSGQLLLLKSTAKLCLLAPLHFLASLQDRYVCVWWSSIYVDKNRGHLYLLVGSLFYVAHVHAVSIALTHFIYQVVNFMSTDSDRIVNFCASFHQFWSLPFQVIVSLALLYQQVHMYVIILV